MFSNVMRDEPEAIELAQKHLDEARDALDRAIDAAAAANADGGPSRLARVAVVRAVHNFERAERAFCSL